MPTVIEELVTKVTLDVSELDKRIKELEAKYKRVKFDSNELVDFFVASSKRIAGALGIAFSIERTVQWLHNIEEANFQLGFLSHTLDISAQDLWAWQRTAVHFGGTAEGMNNSISSLVDGFEQFSITGQSSTIPYLRAMGIGFSDAAGHMRPINDILMQLAAWAETQPDKARAAAFLRGAGITDQGTINLILAGTKALHDYFEEQKKLAPTPQQLADSKALAQTTRDLDSAWTHFGNTLLDLVAPALTSTLNGTNDLLKAMTSNDNSPADEAQNILDLVDGWLGITPDKKTPTSPLLSLEQKLENSGPQAVSPKGAIGRNQILPGTAKQYGFDPSKLTDPEYNDMVASAILASLSKKYHGNLADILIAYNAGPGRVALYEKGGLSALPKETQNYLLHAQRLLGTKIDSRSHRETHIGQITVHTQATDAPGIARGIGSAVEDVSFSSTPQGPS